MIARIEAIFAMSYLLGSALMTFLFYVLIFHLWRSCWMLGGRKLRDCKARQSQIEDTFGNPCSIQVRDGSRWKEEVESQADRTFLMAALWGSCWKLA